MALTDNQKGAGIMSLSGASFITSDMVFQTISRVAPLPQFLFLRGIIVSSLMLGMAKRDGRAFPRDKKLRRLMMLRGFVELYIAFGFLTTLRHVPLSAATAINQTVPLVMTMAAYFIVGEKFGLRRFSAILVGFLGVLLIIKPGIGVFNPYYLLNVSVVIAITMRDLISRQFPKDVPSVWVAFVTVFIVTIANGVLSLFWDWSALDWHYGIMVVICACFVTFGHLTIVMAMRIGEINFVAPFRYSAILVAVIYDIVIFKSPPDAWSIVGCVLVTAAGIFTLKRESQHTNREANQEANE